MTDNKAKLVNDGLIFVINTIYLAKSIYNTPIKISAMDADNLYFLYHSSSVLLLYINPPSVINIINKSA